MQCPPLAGGRGALGNVQCPGGLRLGVSCEVPQDHHRPQFLRQAADGLLQGQGVIGIRTGALRQSLLPGQAPPAPQLPVARIQHDPGEPGLEKVRLTQLPQSPQGLVYALVHRLQGVGLAAQVQVRRPVQPGPESLRPAGEFVVIHGGPPFSSLHLFESQAAGFVCGGGKIFSQAGRTPLRISVVCRAFAQKKVPARASLRDASAPGRSRPGTVFAVQRRGDRQRRALPAGASAGGAGAPLGITPGDGLSDTHPSAGASPHGCRSGWRRCPHGPASPGWTAGPRRFPAGGRQRSGAGCGG